MHHQEHNRPWSITDTLLRKPASRSFAGSSNVAEPKVSVLVVGTGGKDTSIAQSFLVRQVVQCLQRCCTGCAADQACPISWSKGASVSRAIIRLAICIARLWSSDNIGEVRVCKICRDVNSSLVQLSSYKPSRGTKSIPSGGRQSQHSVD